MREGTGVAQGVVPLVVAGMGLQGISLMRNFGRRGIRTYGIDTSNTQIGFRSRHGKKMVCPDPEFDPDDWVAFMLELATDIGGDAVLLPTADKYVLAIDAHADQLRSSYRFPHAPGMLHSTLTNKRDTFALAAQHRFPMPKTCFPSSEEDVSTFATEAEFPCLIKPELSWSWGKQGKGSPVHQRKVMIAQTPEELQELYRQVVSIAPQVVIQEVVPGPDRNLLYFVGYLNRDQDMLGAFAGRKERVTPIHFGSASYVDTIYEPQLEAQCYQFLKALGYSGICGIEVKRDDRTGEMKLIEINPRYGLWDEIGEYLGVDIGYMAYQDLLGLTVAPRRCREPNYRWVSLYRDAGAFMQYRSEGAITVSEWLRSFRPPILWTDVSVRDLPLSWYVIGSLVRGVLARVRG